MTTSTANSPESLDRMAFVNSRGETRYAASRETIVREEFETDRRVGCLKGYRYNLDESERGALDAPSRREAIEFGFWSVDYWNTRNGTRHGRVFGKSFSGPNGEAEARKYASEKFGGAHSTHYTIMWGHSGTRGQEWTTAREASRYAAETWGEIAAEDAEHAAQQAAEETGATLDDYYESAPGIVHVVLAEETP